MVQVEIVTISDNYIGYVYGKDDHTPELHDGEVDVNAEV